MSNVEASTGGAPKPPFSTRTLLIAVLAVAVGGIVGLGVGISATAVAVMVWGVGITPAIVVGCVLGLGAAITTALKAALALNKLVADKSI